jgi:putative ABC transport system permease protein
MNLLHIAWRNLRHRTLSSVLTILSMALGVCLCIIVLSLSNIINNSLQRNSNVGYNLIVGASKGSGTQLVFNTVFYLGKPTDPLKYEHFLEFLTSEQRVELKQRVNGKADTNEESGRYSQFMDGGFAIPVCLGDYVDEFRLVATTTDFFEKLRYGDAGQMQYKFAQGRNFVERSDEHGFFEAVIGTQVARKLDLKLGDKIYASHGPDGMTHEDPFTIVGILDTTGTPNDRAAFCNIEGFFLMEGHAAPERDEAGIELPKNASIEDVQRSLTKRLPIDKREVTVVLVKHGMGGMPMARAINRTTFAQAVSPIGEITTLLQIFVKPVQVVLLLLTFCVCLVSAVSILVSIYNSMNERTRDIAVMRALGASRDQVMLIIFCESLLITLLGAACGILAGKLLAFALSPISDAMVGIKIPFLSMNTPWEPIVIGTMIVVGTCAGLLPAVVAYRTNVAKNL